MTYEACLGLDRQQLLEKMRGLMSDKRLAHCLRVEKAAMILAERYGYDRERAGLAGLLHDYAKELPDAEFLALIDRYQLDPDLKNWNNNIWHGLVGIYKIKEDLQIEDQEILTAIAHHTVGSSQMSILDKIIYVADYIEEGRSFPAVQEARQIAEQSLDRAVAYETANTVAYLSQKGLPIYPQTMETYEVFSPYLRKE